ncbi:MAG: hypothetical protein WCK53_08020 [Methanomicrobiales archaeon]
MSAIADATNPLSERIPAQLMREDLRFIRIPRGSKGGKDENEVGWNRDKNYPWNNPALHFFLHESWNYGVFPASGSPVVIIDVDEYQALYDIGALTGIDGETFTVESGSSTSERRKYHIYLECQGLEGKTVLFGPDDLHLGELFAQHPEKGKGYVIGPGSVHPSGNRYVVAVDSPILKITQDQLFEILLSKVNTSENNEPEPQTIRRPGTQYRNQYRTLTETLNLDISVCRPDNARRSGNEIVGANPVHGSTSGTNFSANSQKNTWHCWRCSSGGDPLLWIAVESGIIRCDEARPGALKDREKMEALTQELIKRGYPVTREPKSKPIEVSKPGIVAGGDIENEPSSSLSSISSVTVNQIEGLQLEKSKNRYTNEARKTTLITYIRYAYRTAKGRDKQASALDKAVSFNLKRCDPPLTTDELKGLFDRAISDLITLGALGAVDESEIIIEDEEIHTEALTILTTGDPIKTFSDTFSTLHSGDGEIGKVFLCSWAVQCATTTTGIQPGLDGRKGSGKTSGARAAIHLYPQEYVFDTSFSNKALFYDKRIQPGCVVFSDDTTLPAELATTIKRAMSKFQTGTEHLTVEKTDTGTIQSKRVKIPERVTFIFTAVYDSGDDEILDRQYRLSLAPDAAAGERFTQFLKDRMKSGREEYPITREVRVCREMLRIMKSQLFRVKIPFSDDIIFSDTDARRDMIMLFDFIQASAVIHSIQREQVEENGIIDLTATTDDFNTASEIFKASENTRLFRLSKDERALLDWLADHSKLEGITETDIIKKWGAEAGYNRMRIRRLLYGEDDKAGLVNKVPRLYIEKQSIPSDSDHFRRTQCNVIFCPATLKSNLFTHSTFVSLKNTGGES